MGEPAADDADHHRQPVGVRGAVVWLQHVRQERRKEGTSRARMKRMKNDLKLAGATDGWVATSARWFACSTTATDNCGLFGNKCSPQHLHLHLLREWSKRERERTHGVDTRS